ncbi:MAG: hypothetical protein GH144_01200 [Clostridia bacterium]|jgi:hypothetical protein|nr:hypothetical protein [Clostridia bacterium]
MTKTFKTEASTIKLSKKMTKELRQLREKEDISSMSDALFLYLDRKADEKVERLKKQLNWKVTKKLLDAIGNGAYTSMLDIKEIKEELGLHSYFEIMTMVMVIGLSRAIGPEKITSDPDGQKKIKEAINTIEKNAPTLERIINAGLAQAADYQKKYPLKEGQELKLFS